jgi:DNA-binding NarL/FixJ family response regulator
MGGTTMAKLRILLADDQTMLCDGLSALINAQADMEVVGRARNGGEAVRLAEEGAPDVAVLDVSLTDVTGIEAVQQIAARVPPTRVVAISRNADPGCARRAFRAGASGFVLKRSAAEALIHAIRVVADGESYIEPELAVEMFSLAGLRPDHAGSGHRKLSQREEEVMRSIAWGLSNKEIAGELGLSIKTVESYKASALEKLRLRTRADIVRYAVRTGWLSPERMHD